MNQLLKSVKPEVLIDQRKKLYKELAITINSTFINFIESLNKSLKRVVFETQKQKRIHYSDSVLQRNYSVQKLLKASIFLLLLIFHVTSASLPKITPENRFTEQEIELIRNAFLKKFGMKEQPKQSEPTMPVPNYIWNIYENVKNEDVEWVRHYYPHNIMDFDDNTILLHYDLSVTVQNATNEIVNRAELKLKLKKEEFRRHIRIYEIDQINPEIWRLLDAKFIENSSRANYKWIELDVTEAAQRKRPNMNRIDFGIKLSDDHSALHPSTSSQTTTIFSASSNNRKQTAALVLYVQTNDDTVKKRTKRKANARRRHQHKKHNHKPLDKNYCRRTELLVDFNELNWQDWILAPSSFSAYQCQGECPNPLTNHFNTTNHAIVQGLINSVDPSLVPAPCCVPTEMESLAILYIDVEGKIVIKNYPDMEVLSCGCR